MNDFVPACINQRRLIQFARAAAGDNMRRGTAQIAVARKDHARHRRAAGVEQCVLVARALAHRLDLTVAAREPCHLQPEVVPVVVREVFKRERVRRAVAVLENHPRVVRIERHDLLIVGRTAATLISAHRVLCDFDKAVAIFITWWSAAWARTGIQRRIRLRTARPWQRAGIVDAHNLAADIPVFAIGQPPDYQWFFRRVFQVDVGKLKAADMAGIEQRIDDALMAICRLSGNHGLAATFAVGVVDHDRSGRMVAFDNRDLLRIALAKAAHLVRQRIARRAVIVRWIDKCAGFFLDIRRKIGLPALVPQVPPP